MLEVSGDYQFSGRLDYTGLCQVNRLERMNRMPLVGNEDGSFMCSAIQRLSYPSSDGKRCQ